VPEIAPTYFGQFYRKERKVAKHKEGAQAIINEILGIRDGKASRGTVPDNIAIGLGIISALLFIGEVLEKYLKEIASNTKRIGNG
jgi:hypothetical protein